MVVLAGGSARRLGGVDKCALLVGGAPVLARVVTACTGAGVAPDDVVVVGPPRPGLELPVGVRTVREDPLGGGPVAGLAAGLRLVLGRGEPAGHAWAVDAVSRRHPGDDGPAVDALVVLAGDLPLLRPEHVAALRRRLGRPPAADVVVAVDAEGRVQPLVAVWRVAALGEEVGRLPPGGRSARSLLDRHAVVHLPLVGHPDPLLDVDDEAALAQARTLADEARGRRRRDA